MEYDPERTYVIIQKYYNNEEKAYDNINNILSNLQKKYNFLFFAPILYFHFRFKWLKSKNKKIPKLSTEILNLCRRWYTGNGGEYKLVCPKCNMTDYYQGTIHSCFWCNNEDEEDILLEVSNYDTGLTLLFTNDCFIWDENNNIVNFSDKDIQEICEWAFFDNKIECLNLNAFMLNEKIEIDLPNNLF